MRARRMIWRIVRGLVVGACCGYVALLAVVQVGQRVVRYRAERMMGEVAGFRVGVTTWSDFQGFQRRWGRWGHYNGECNASHCEYSVRMGDWFGSFLWRSTAFLGDAQEAAINSLVIATRAHLPAVVADISIKDGAVASFRSSIWAEVPKGRRFGWRDGGKGRGEYVPYRSYTLVAGYQSGTIEDGLPLPWTEPIRPHPDYEVMEPTGCLNCISIHLVVNPGISAKSLESRADLNMDCLTRWTFCVDEADIAPKLWEQYLEDRAMRMQLDRCDYPFSQMYQAAENVMLVYFDRVLASDMPNVDRPIPYVRFVKAIKGDINFRPGDLMHLSEDRVGPYTGEPEQAGNVLIVMFPGDVSKHVDLLRELGVYQCGIMDASPERLAEMATLSR